MLTLFSAITTFNIPRVIGFVDCQSQHIKAVRASMLQVSFPVLETEPATFLSSERAIQNSANLVLD